jgi:stearoyl-CoA desaturase (Delta-9 desaturase)
MMVTNVAASHHRRECPRLSGQMSILRRVMWRILISGLLIGFVVTMVANFCTTVYLHRALAHGALTTKAWLGAVFKVVLWVSTGMREREWVAVHRKHHAFTDQREDPHSPAVLGWLRVQLTNPALYRRVARDEAQVARYTRDLPPTRADRVLFDHALLGLAVGVVLLVLAFGWQRAVVAASFHVVLYLGLSGSVNSVAHTFGKRTYATSATNVQWLALITAGEGLHNNHHAAPTSARLSLNKHEFDPAWRPIQLMGKLGWLTIRHRTPKFVVDRRTGVSS